MRGLAKQSNIQLSLTASTTASTFVVIMKAQQSQHTPQMQWPQKLTEAKWCPKADHLHWSLISWQRFVLFTIWISVMKKNICTYELWWTTLFKINLLNFPFGGD